MVSAVAQSGPDFDCPPLNDLTPPSFEHRLVAIPNFLPPASLNSLRADVEHLVGPDRSYVPTHKKGGTIGYETLIATAPGIVAFYRSGEFQRFISRLVGIPVQQTPLHDQSSLSVLFYDRPGDHIGWHYDHNFYRGRHFTVLLTVINEGTVEGGRSHAELRARVAGKEVTIVTAPNTLVVFEGARVRHRVIPLIAGERRMVVSMTYCSNPAASRWQGMARRVKDTAFFGIKALWI
jgi:hypothetical protein